MRNAVNMERVMTTGRGAARLRRPRYIASLLRVEIEEALADGFAGALLTLLGDALVVRRRARLPADATVAQVVAAMRRAGVRFVALDGGAVREHFAATGRPFRDAFADMVAAGKRISVEVIPPTPKRGKRRGSE